MSEETGIAGVKLTHPDRILFPEQGLTKQQLAEYYVAIADWVLPHVVERPLTLVRCPQGRADACFYQKHWSETLPPALDQVQIKEKSTTRRYLVIHDLAGLISLVQMSVLEVHPWGSRIDKIDRPDRIVFDLDPGDEVAWDDVRKAAVRVGDVLTAVGLTPFVRTSGGKGLHVVVPIDRRSSWEEVKEFAHQITGLLVRAHPEQYVGQSTKLVRRGKVFIDYLRNTRGATAVASYSTRAHAGAPVATPISWDELDKIESSRAYDVTTISRRLHQLKKDPWEQFSSVRQSLSRKVLAQLEGLASK